MWALVSALLIAIVITAFASLNSTPVAVNFFFWKAPAVSLALVILLSVFLGVILALLFMIPGYFKALGKNKEKKEEPPKDDIPKQ